MVKIDTEQRRVECTLDEDERQERALKAAELSAQAGEEKARAIRMKEEAAALLKQSEARSQEAGKLLSYFKDGKEPRDVECRVMYDSDSRKVRVYEGDGFKLLESRAPTEADWTKIKKARQPELFRQQREIEDVMDDGPRGVDMKGALEDLAKASRPRGKKAAASPDKVNLTVVKPIDEQPAAQ